MNPDSLRLPTVVLSAAALFLLLLILPPPSFLPSERLGLAQLVPAVRKPLTPTIKAPLAPISALPSAPLTPPVSYGTGVVTPANREILYLFGPDYNGALAGNAAGIRNIGEDLKNLYGYELSMFDTSSLNSLFQPSSLLSALKRAQTLILATHGFFDGSFGAMCYNNIVFSPDGAGNMASPSCCAKVKEISSELGLATNNLNCNQPPILIQYRDGPRLEYADDSHTIIGTTIHDAACTLVPGELINSCSILFSPKIYDLIGPKAAVFTTQCYGGGPCAPNLYNNVMAYWTAAMPGHLGYIVNEKIDTKLLRQDLTGSNLRYLRCSANPPSPVATPFCVSPLPKDELRGFDDNSLVPNWQRVVEQSWSVRGNFPASQDLDTIINPENGNDYYIAAYVRGNSATSVEFAPAFNYPTYTPANTPGVTFMASTTSRIKTSNPAPEVTLTLSPQTPRRRSDVPSYLSLPRPDDPTITTRLPIFTERGVYFSLNPDAFGHFLTKAEWDLPEDQFFVKYGAHKKTTPIIWK